MRVSFNTIHALIQVLLLVANLVIVGGIVHIFGELLGDPSFPPEHVLPGLMAWYHQNGAFLLGLPFLWALAAVGCKQASIRPIMSTIVLGLGVCLTIALALMTVYFILHFPPGRSGPLR